MSQIALPPPSTRRPPRSLPWDVLLLVFQQSSPSTLAALGGVSFDFLTSTASLLYREVEVKTIKQLEKLFCERLVVGRRTKNFMAQSRIHHLLNLSQIKNLSLNFASLSSQPDALRVSSSRLSFNPISLNVLHLSVQHLHNFVAELVYTSLFPLLNPVTLEMEGQGRPYAYYPWISLGNTPVLTGWSRLEGLDFEGVLTFHSWPDRLAALPPPSLHRRRTVRIHLASVLCRQRPEVRDILEYMLEEFFSAVVQLNQMQEGSMVLVVESEEERKEAEAAVASIGVQRWRSKFAVELEA